MAGVIEKKGAAASLAAVVAELGGRKREALRHLARVVGPDRVAERCQAIGRAIDHCGAAGLETLGFVRLATALHRAGADDATVDRVLGAVRRVVGDSAAGIDEVGARFCELIESGEDAVTVEVVRDFLAAVPRAGDAAEEAFGTSDAGAIVSLVVTADVFVREMIWRGFPRLAWLEDSPDDRPSGNFPLERFVLSAFELVLSNHGSEAEVEQFFEGLLARFDAGA